MTEKRKKLTRVEERSLKDICDSLTHPTWVYASAILKINVFTFPDRIHLEVKSSYPQFWDQVLSLIKKYSPGTKVTRKIILTEAEQQVLEAITLELMGPIGANLSVEKIEISGIAPSEFPQELCVYLVKGSKKGQRAKIRAQVAKHSPGTKVTFRVVGIIRAL